MILQAAETSDLSTVLSWVADEQKLRTWAGPVVRHPVSPKSVWSDIEASENNAYIFMDARDSITGFGQILLRNESTVHLARLIVNPELRGRGIGRRLCVALMKMGDWKHHPKSFTLNVYESNKVAIGLYQSLGFIVKLSGDESIITMIKSRTNIGEGRS